MRTVYPMGYDCQACTAWLGSNLPKLITRQLKVKISTQRHIGTQRKATREIQENVETPGIRGLSHIMQADVSPEMSREVVTLSSIAVKAELDEIVEIV